MKTENSLLSSLLVFGIFLLCFNFSLISAFQCYSNRDKDWNFVDYTYPWDCPVDEDAKQIYCLKYVCGERELYTCAYDNSRHKLCEDALYQNCTQCGVCPTELCNTVDWKPFVGQQQQEQQQGYGSDIPNNGGNSFVNFFIKAIFGTFSYFLLTMISGLF